MMLNKKFIALVMILTLIVNFSLIGFIPVSAHSTILNVDYDDCDGKFEEDGPDEMWYVLEKDGVNHHISHEVETIRYYFENTSEWIPYKKSSEVGEEIKAAIANSIEKWNNVYFYSYNADGTITKKKLVNVEQVTEGPYELLIYPSLDRDDAAATRPDPNPPLPSGHYHISNWVMQINVEFFIEGTSYQLTSEQVHRMREDVGAHEFGHILGLRDVDYIDELNNNDDICNAELGNVHHSELLMGYSEKNSPRSSNITYKDIAGVAITRGFHIERENDDDHEWLHTWDSSKQQYKLICSICNGVKYVNSISGISYFSYGCCEGDHKLSDGNMMAVASYGNQDYYKCKYCRYVAPFSAIVDQNYNKTFFSDTLHKCENTVYGLEYTFYEEHTFVNNVCTECGYVHTHTYSSYVYQNNTSHKKTCSCGHVETQAHYIYASDIVNGRYATCLGCGELLDLQYDMANSIMSNITKVSINGSYIRSDGIVVLVDADVEAYLAGTLQFYHPANLPVTQ